jgi:uncharacterized repeat protein (TIGR04076 family)
MVETVFGEVVARIVSQNGTCAADHKVGDEFIIGATTPIGMCSWAFYSLFPFVSVLQFGGSFPWEDSVDKSIAVCPDPINPVVFELRRIHSYTSQV